MKKVSVRVPNKKGPVYKFIGRTDMDLKRRMARAVDYLKVHDDKHDWSQNALIVASIEAYLDDLDMK